MVDKDILKKAYEVIEYRNYERICFIAGICPKCGKDVRYTLDQTEESPVIEFKYICSDCGYLKEENKLRYNIDKEKSILKFKQKIHELTLSFWDDLDNT